MIHHYLTLLIAILMMVPSPFTHADESLRDMSLHQVLVVALSDSPDLQLSLEDVAIAEEDLDLARSNYRPDVNATANISHFQRDTDLQDEWQSDTEKTVALNISQSLYRGGQTDADVSEQRFLRDAQQNFYTADVNDEVVDIVEAYMATYTANQSRMVNADNVILLMEQLNATRARFEAGELTKTDVAQAEASLAGAKAEKSRSDAIFEVALSGFRQVTGIIEEIGMMYPVIDIKNIPETLDQAINIATNQNPDLQAAQDQIAASRFAVRESKGGFYPEVDVNAGIELSRDPAFSQSDRTETASFALVASMPIYERGIIRNQLRQSQIRESQALLNKESVRRNVVDEVISAWEEYKAIHVEIEAREAQLEAVKLAFNGVTLEEQVGARSILDVLDANQAVLEAELSLIEARGDKVNAYYTLMTSMGAIDHSAWDKVETGL